MRANVNMNISLITGKKIYRDGRMISYPSSSPFRSRAPYTQAYRPHYADLHSGSDVTKCMRVRRFPFFFDKMVASLLK